MCAPLKAPFLQDALITISFSEAQIKYFSSVRREVSSEYVVSFSEFASLNALAPIVLTCIPNVTFSLALLYAK